MRSYLLLGVVQWFAGAISLAKQPNPPNWPDSVAVFGPETPVGDIQGTVNKAFTQNGGQSPGDHGQFSSARFAFLFKPGSYAVEVPVGYYTQVLGLGASPTDVKFISAKGVYCVEGSFNVSPGALNTFWRSAENFQTDANFQWTDLEGMLWAASQASPLRRIVVTNGLKLYQFRQGDQAAGYASGGFLANAHILGTVASGSQQQYITRNSKVDKWQNGVWNMVFVGVDGAPSSHCGANPSLCSSPYVTVDTTPLVAEKPFISIDSNGKYSLNIPKAQANSKGFNFNEQKIIQDFEQVYVANADSDTASTINQALSEGLSVVLSPGIYNLDAALFLNTENQVLLGLGLATLIPTKGTEAIVVGNVDGVRVAGVLLQAGTGASPALLTWGKTGYAGNSNNPGFLFDVFARVGGPKIDDHQQARAMVMVQINSGNVVGDNLWLWRADHTETGLVYKGDNPCDNAIVVDGDDVIMYGLATEHTLKDLCVWNGENGKSYFFQAELPYDVTQANYGNKGYVGYRVNAKVTKHTSYGAGVYHFFRDEAVVVETGISVPSALESSFVAPLAVFLDGLGVMNHILNGKGNQTAKGGGSSGGGGPDGAVAQWICGHVFFSANRSALSSLSSFAPTCKVGDPVTCPGSSVGCAGNSCCPDGSTCPSANNEFKCCPLAKKEDCTT